MSTTTSAGSLSSAPDDNLIREAIGGSTDAFGVLYERYKNAVYVFVIRSVGRTEDAEDMVQEVFCRAWRAIPRFRGDAKLLTWLYAIAANLIKEHYRSAARRPCPTAEVELDPEQLSSDKYRFLDPEEVSLMRHEVTRALASLPLTHKMLVLLCDVEGLSSAEAAKVVGCSAISVRVKLSRARAKMRKLLAHLVEEVN